MKIYFSVVRKFATLIAFVAMFIGSYAAASTTTDSDAPSTNPKHSGDGERK